jgi:hypothetical protein
LTGPETATKHIKESDIKMSSKGTVTVPIEKLTGMIYSIRGQKVMLSTQLADLYGVEPRVLVQAVKRNIERFPKDFMFQLTQKEFTNLKSQIVTSSWGGMRRSTPYAFTEQGVAMLSSVLRSKRAILLGFFTCLIYLFARLQGRSCSLLPRAPW